MYTGILANGIIDNIHHGKWDCSLMIFILAISIAECLATSWFRILQHWKEKWLLKFSLPSYSWLCPEDQS